jgi:hypothetical protein
MVQNMNKILKEKIIEVCNKKIALKGESVGLSFYAFFENKNTNHELLIEAAQWWISTHKLDHFEKAMKIKKWLNYHNEPNQTNHRRNSSNRKKDKNLFHYRVKPRNLRL